MLASNCTPVFIISPILVCLSTTISAPVKFLKAHTSFHYIFYHCSSFHSIICVFQIKKSLNRLLPICSSPFLIRAGKELPWQEQELICFAKCTLLYSFNILLSSAATKIKRMPLISCHALVSLTNIITL